MLFLSELLEVYHTNIEVTATMVVTEVNHPKDAWNSSTEPTSIWPEKVNNRVPASVEQNMIHHHDSTYRRILEYIWCEAMDNHSVGIYFIIYFPPI